MGFKQVDIARALEQASFHVGRALLMLLNGLEASRDSKRFDRHALKQIMSADAEKLAGGEVAAQHGRRAQTEFHFTPRVRDLGQHAGDATGACFWLCLAAGLAERGPRVLARGSARPCVRRGSP